MEIPLKRVFFAFNSPQRRPRALPGYSKHLFLEQNCVNKTNPVFIFQKKDFFLHTVFLTRIQLCDHRHILLNDLMFYN